jgi:hypothetical protein
MVGEELDRNSETFEPLRYEVFLSEGKTWATPMDFAKGPG